MKKIFLNIIISTLLVTAPVITVANIPVNATQSSQISTENNNVNIRLFSFEGQTNAQILLPNNISPKSVEISKGTVRADIVDGSINLYNLENGKTYSNIVLNVTDTQNKTHSFTIENISIPKEKVLSSLYVRTSKFESEPVGVVMLPKYLKGNIVSANIKDSSLVADPADGVLTLYGLKPNTDYTNLVVNIKDINNINYSVILNDFSTSNKLGKEDISKYVENVYLYGLDRIEIDAGGLNHWVTSIENKEITLKQFIESVIASEEFKNTSYDHYDKIRRISEIALYKNSFPTQWISEFEKDLEITKNKDTSLLNITNKILSSTEFNNISKNLGL